MGRAGGGGGGWRGGRGEDGRGRSVKTVRSEKGSGGLKSMGVGGRRAPWQSRQNRRGGSEDEV